MIHGDGAGLVIDLGIHAGIPDQIHNPLLALLQTQPEPRAQIPDIDPLVDLAVRLRDEVARGLDEIRRDVVLGEEVGRQHRRRARQLRLRLREVKVHVQRPDERRRRVAVLVPLLPHHPRQVLDLLLVRRARARGALGGLAGRRPPRDHRRREVPQQPRARRLQRVDVAGGEEEVEQRLARVRVVEEREQRPVQQPGAVVELGERGIEEARLDGLADLGDLLERRLPVRLQHLARQLPPVGVRDQVVVRRQDPELEQHVARPAVVAQAVQELPVLVQPRDVRRLHPVVLPQPVQVRHLVAAQAAAHALVVQQVRQPRRVLLELLPPGQDLFASREVLRRRLREVVQLAVEVRHVVGHVGFFEQGVFEGFGRVRRRVCVGLGFEELEDGKYEVAVEMRDEFREQGGGVVGVLDAVGGRGAVSRHGFWWGGGTV